MQNNIQKKQRLLITAILVVSVLLLINLLLLSILLGKHIGTSRANDNYIGETQQAALPSGRISYLRASVVPLGLFSSDSDRAEEKLSLSFWNGYSGEKTFSMLDMLPGDSDTKKYTVTVRSKEATALIFDIDIKQNSPLAKVLILTVVANGEPLYSDTLAKMSPLSVDLKSGVASQEVVYEITALLPTWADNSVADLSLSVDFLWSLDENVAPETSETTTPKPPETTSGGGGGGGGWWPIEPDETTETTGPAETTEPIETETETETESESLPSESEHWPSETDTTEPPETRPDPPETRPDPPTTRPDPSGTERDPSETTSELPPVDCTVCVVDKVIERFIGQKDERCPICDTVESIFAVDDICICPYGCFLVLILILLLILLILLTILYYILKRRAEKKQEELAEQMAEELMEELPENLTETSAEEPTENDSDDL